MFISWEVQGTHSIKIKDTDFEDTIMLNYGGDNYSISSSRYRIIECIIQYYKDNNLNVARAFAECLWISYREKIHRRTILTYAKQINSNRIIPLLPIGTLRCTRRYLEFKNRFYIETIIPDPIDLDHD